MKNNNQESNAGISKSDALKLVIWLFHTKQFKKVDMTYFFSRHFNGYILWLNILFFLLTVVPVSAQDDPANVKKSRAYMGLEFSQSKEDHILLATVTARVEGMRGRQKVENAQVDFYILTDTTEILLGNSTTDNDGKAHFVIEKVGQMYGRAIGELTFTARFAGNEAYDPAAKQITVGTVNMTISFEEVDSVKRILVRAFEIGPEGEGEPLEETVNFYVPRSFSLLKIGEGDLEAGICNIDFPVTLPGDSIGKLQIIARIEESDDYGNVEAASAKDWGLARPRVVVEKRRGLGDTDAPLWMVYTLIVLLSAVWFHYLYILYVFSVIKKEGRNQKKALINS